MSTSKLTDQQVVERLARREGAEQPGWELVGSGPFCFHWPKTRTMRPAPDYIHDHSAVQRVMRLLTPTEMDRFLYRACGNADGARWLTFEQLQHILLRPPADLARLVAEVLPS